MMNDDKCEDDTGLEMNMGQISLQKENGDLYKIRSMVPVSGCQCMGWMGCCL